MHRIGPTLFFKPLFLASLAFVAISPAQAADPEPHTITVSGEGEVKAVPDEAVLTAGVESTGTTADAALAANRRAMSNVFATLKRQGIPDKSIQTSGFNISPQYEAGNHNRQRIVGYQASNNVEITIDDTSKLGASIDALVASGANSMGGVSFTTRDPRPLLKQARESAVKDAMDRAETYAQAAGLTLGRVIEIDDGEVQIPRPMFRSVGTNRFVAGMETPIAAGQQSVTARVTVQFEIP